eukprot:7387909-Prymnesium_polylepis.1
MLRSGDFLSLESVSSSSAADTGTGARRSAGESMRSPQPTARPAIRPTRATGSGSLRPWPGEEGCCPHGRASATCAASDTCD